MFFAALKGTLILVWVVYAVVWSIARWVFLFLIGLQFLKLIIGSSIGRADEAAMDLFVWFAAALALEMMSRVLPVAMKWVD